MSPVFVIIDGSSLIHRAFYALPLLTTSSGEYTNAVYGFTNMMIKLLTDIKPDLIAVAFDKGRVTFRNNAYAEYKAQRKATPIELVGQFPLVQELLEAFGIVTIEEAGYEADDIIGTLAAKACSEGYNVTIVTGDRDALQLIEANVKVLLTKKGISEMEMYDSEAFRARYGLEPKQLIDLKGLMGDTSDNIPGIPGVGEKTGLKLIQEFGSVENLLNNIDKVSGQKLKEKLMVHGDLAILSKKLATIVCDMQVVEFLPQQLTITPNTAKIEELLTRFEFRSLMPRLKTLFKEQVSSDDTDKKDTLPKAKIITDQASVEKVVNRVYSLGVMFCYPVRIGLPHNDDLAGIAIYVDGESYYIPASSEGWTVIVKLLSSADVQKVTHDAKLLAGACRQMSIEFTGLLFDTLIAAYLLDPTSSEYALVRLFEDYVGQKFALQEKETDAAYACWAASAIHLLYPILLEVLTEKKIDKLYQNIELPLIEVLADMEHSGIAVDIEKLSSISHDISKRIAVLLAEIASFAGEEFNVNSTKQLGHILFEKLGLPVIKKTKTGYSTDAEVLDKLVGKHPIINYLLEYRTLTKLKSTYLDGIRGLIDKNNHRIHTSFNQTVTATGRLSSSEPNLQNIPIRTEEGRQIRELFVPGSEWQYIMSADYSQIELRVLAHMSGDNNLVESFVHNQDVHTRTAAEVFGLSMAEVTSEMRAKAKAVNFGIIYGISDYGLSRDLGISRREASHYIESYFAKYQGVKAYIDRVVGEAHRDGYVTTMFGRRRFLPDINSNNFNRRSFAERTAMNTPIQGTAADIIKKAMIDVYRALRQHRLKSRMLLQVHDELLLEVVHDEVDIVTKLVKDAMEHAAELQVPLVVDVKLGDNWAKAK